MDKEARKSLRSMLEALKKEGLILETDKEVDPNQEMTGLQKQLDGGPPMVFNNVKGYPNARLATNVARTARNLSSGSTTAFCSRCPPRSWIRLPARKWSSIRISTSGR
jgi:UbiD family decarboxylase